MSDAEWLESRIVDRIDWAPGLATFVTDADVGDFHPGQFVDLAVDAGGERISRSYSIASAPGQGAEFYVTLVRTGQLTPHLFARSAGDIIFVRKRAVGLFSVDRVPDAHSLWLVGTGTGLGPYIAMLRSGHVWTRFSRTVLVHGVREVGHLSYARELAAWSRDHGLLYVPVVSRQAPPEGGIEGRITRALQSRALEERAGLPIEAESAHVMLCGNPDMVAEMKGLLIERGLKQSTPRRPGQFTLESYW